VFDAIDTKLSDMAAEVSGGEWPSLLGERALNSFRRVASPSKRGYLNAGAALRRKRKFNTRINAG
jgi:hypothetical protein